jgi:glutamine amidotransferase PdxT
MIGILGLQGDYAAHGKMLDAIDTPNRVVKKPDQLTEIDGLIFPGGESTTLIKLMDAWGWWQPLKDFADTKPVFGTCAGMILVAKKVSNTAKIAQPHRYRCRTQRLRSSSRQFRRQRLIARRWPGAQYADDLYPRTAHYANGPWCRDTGRM